MSPVRGRAALGLARIEAVLLARSVLVLAGLLVGGIAVWVFSHRDQPVWWNDGWEIGYGQVIISLTVLIAAQLATARVRRDGLEDLYESFPTNAGRRTVAHLLGLRTLPLRGPQRGNCCTGQLRGHRLRLVRPWRSTRKIVSEG